MSARKIGSVGSLQQDVTVEARQVRLTLAHDSVVIQENGIEFRSATPFNVWAEMTITVQSPDSGTAHCSGVVISCTGNKHTGYHVMVFTGMSKQAKARLSLMAASGLS
jgi:hypothetical protein